MARFHTSIPHKNDVDLASTPSRETSPAPSLPDQPVHMARFSPYTAIAPTKSLTKKHAFLMKIARVQGSVDLPQTSQVKLFKAIDGVTARCKTLLKFNDLSNLFPETRLFKDGTLGNHYIDFYTSTPFDLPDSYVVNQLEARVASDDQSIKILMMHLEGATINKKILENQYGALHGNLMRGESRGEMVFLASKQSWGELRFGYNPDRPDLLKLVVFDTNKF